MSQRYVILDYETRSDIDLKKVGAFEYSKHPSTRILCASWRVGTKEELYTQLQNKRKWDKENAHKAEWADTKNPYNASTWCPVFDSETIKYELLRLIIHSNYKLVAHNALFEQLITKNVFYKTDTPLFRPIRWICTASMARAMALPGNLEGACEALHLETKKDMEGRRLILKYCKPRKLSANNDSKYFNSVRDLKRIVEYCQTDVDAETELFLTLPMLNDLERKIWLLDQKINLRGFNTDQELINSALQMIDQETKNLNKETFEITNGEISTTNKRQAVIDWLGKNGVVLDDLRSKTVADTLKAGAVTGHEKRILEIRQSVSKTSTAKYVAFKERSKFDGRVRDILVYHTASTGRWGGAGVQPQNFPRGKIKDTNLGAEVIRDGNLETLRLIYENPMDVLSSCLRSVIIPSEGKEFFCGDYAGVELRVLFWIADHVKGISKIEKGSDLYVDLAKEIFSKEEISADQRFVGKQATLGCGYQMGWKKFMGTCESLGKPVDEDIAQNAVTTYRRVNKPVVQSWYDTERAAILAITHKPMPPYANKVSWFVEGDFLFCELPSKRRLAYYKPVVKKGITPWGEEKQFLYHWGVDPKTRKWSLAPTYGGKLVENIVQAISRDLMAEAMLKIDNAQYDINLSVHDELLAEKEIGKGSLEEFTNLMSSIPPWAKGCPVKVESWTGMRYKK